MLHNDAVLTACPKNQFSAYAMREPINSLPRQNKVAFPNQQSERSVAECFLDTQGPNPPSQNNSTAIRLRRKRITQHNKVEFKAIDIRPRLPRERDQNRRLLNRIHLRRVLWQISQIPVIRGRCA